MMRKFVLGLAVAATVLPTLVPLAGADARTTRSRYVHRYHRTCAHGHGTTGLLVGGATGALIGGAVTHGAAGPIVGAAGGALLGRHIQRHRDC